MKKIILISVVSSALFAPLLAHAEGVYAGLGAGLTKTQADMFPGQLTVVSRDNKPGHKLYLGYDVARNFAWEIRYADLGRSTSLQ